MLGTLGMRQKYNSDATNHRATHILILKTHECEVMEHTWHIKTITSHPLMAIAAIFNSQYDAPTIPVLLWLIQHFCRKYKLLKKVLNNEKNEMRC